MAAKPNEPAPPMILSLPKSIANKINLNIDDDLRMKQMEKRLSFSKVMSSDIGGYSMKE